MRDIRDIAAFIIPGNRSSRWGSLSPQDLAKSNVFWVLVAAFTTSAGAYLLSRYKRRWIVRRPAVRADPTSR